MDKKRSPMPSKMSFKVKQTHTGTSDSEASGETNSLSAESVGDHQNQPPKPPARKKGRRKGSDWEIMEGLKDGQKFEKKPNIFSGFLHKKRKWPLKGWHKVSGVL